jgi:hypothetical protein
VIGITVSRVLANYFQAVIGLIEMEERSHSQRSDNMRTQAATNEVFADSCFGEKNRDAGQKQLTGVGENGITLLISLVSHSAPSAWQS